MILVTGRPAASSAVPSFEAPRGTPLVRMKSYKVWASPESAKGGARMPTHFDHLTIVVRDVDRAKAFFAVLGFKEAIS